MKTEENRQINIGIDVGSVSVDSIVIDEHGQVLEDRYVRHKGKPVETMFEIVKQIAAQFEEDAINRIAFTGEGGKEIAKAMDALWVNEIVAQTKATAFLHPEVRTVIEIGGGDSKLILLNKDPHTKAIVLEDFAMNSVCAAGNRKRSLIS